ncbi:8-amino-7-oxononanoate synthase [Methylomarinovum caldicuralii]|uniref:8-amino-7-oxononanoate synthase n=1 Tax=Methylomarinovum caldicuralii TaxID=438856 RepID=A0AAU9C3W8_9GAMM|nr:8-amino-7-oxononanoate synthase [Methylomarinovum caldicuralii]BCX82408.1 8-amino-7-oxononanoate synthase [Methylomarinovum caldicuralii]
MRVTELSAALAARRAAGLYRHRHVLDSPQGAEVVVDGRRVVNFCSNDYLGLANHPEVVAAWRRGAEAYGVGSGASHLVCGHLRPHHALEEELAAFTGRDRALVFSTGYQANLGVIGALVTRGGRVFEDRLNHASLLDGARLAGARLRRYPHGDLKVLERWLSRGEEALIATDAVFSMDGDLAPLPQLAELARRHDAWLHVDDAHGFGVLGETGAGTLSHFGLDQTQVPVLMATLGKALGVFGAFVAGSDDLIEWLLQSARTYIYTTALPPALAEAARAARRLVQDEDWRRRHLQALTARFRRGAERFGLPLLPSPTPIQPLIVGDNARALRWSRRLLERGYWVAPIRPPTVPAGSARLRITLSAAHSEEQVDGLLAALAELAA